MKHAQRFPWLLLAIAAPAAVEVWTCWVGLGALCGFPKIGHVSTDWTLAVGMEAYGGYALYIWLGGGPGPKSRNFAQWSALGAFALSLIGQVTYHLMLAKHVRMAPTGVVVFVACLLVVVIAFAAILTHLMHTDGREADEAAEESALAAALAEARAARAEAEGGRDVALQQAAGVAREAEVLQRKVDALTQKLAAATATGGAPKRKRTGSGGSGNGNGTRGRKPEEIEEAPEDLDSELKVLWYLDRGLNASQAGKKAGLTDSRGRQIARLRGPAPDGIDKGAS